MAEANIFKLLRKISHDPRFVDAGPIKNTGELGPDELSSLKKLGMGLDSLKHEMSVNLSINYDRYSLYHEYMRALDHWMIGPSMELFADSATKHSSIHGSSVWVTSENESYANTLNEMLDFIGIDERIFDWAYNVAAFGDLFIQPLGKPGTGVYAVVDDINPLEISRLDHKGHLIGFYKTPMAANQHGATNATREQELLSPWEYVHMRLLGVKKLRPLPGDPLHSSNRSTFLTTTDTKQLSAKYGTSLIINALASYKRLRMAEDSVLLARLTRGMIRYIYKLKVDGGNADAVASLTDIYANVLKRSRAFDSSSESDAFYNERPFYLTAMEDLFLPVWGDVGDLDYMKIGEAGDVNIKWIVDIQELRKQVSTALRVPLPLLGSYTDEASGALGAQSIEKLDIGFARSSKRLQRAVVTAITRLCQIHLAYQGKDPDAKMFTVHMNDSSTAEEEEILQNVGKSLTIVQRLIKTAKQIDPEVDESALFDYCNSKFLKLEDFNINDFHSSKVDIQDAIRQCRRRPICRENLDLMSYVPLQKPLGSGDIGRRTISEWKEKYGSQKVLIEEVKVDNRE